MMPHNQRMPCSKYDAVWLTTNFARFAECGDSSMYTHISVEMKKKNTEREREYNHQTR